MAATPYPAYKWHWTHHCTGSVGPRKRSAAGHGYSREPPVCRVAATPYPAYKRHWAHHCTGSVGPRKRMDCTPKVGHPTE
ncbi:hypothetical protein F7P07_17515 [Klebsiella pneumoniae]|nr:hypothetical protein F7P07_17515 [Klebsiella pneumoniae]